MSSFREIVNTILEKVNLTENPNTILKSALLGKNPNVESLTIITAENPFGKKINRRDNATRLKAFKTQLKLGGHPYKNIVGKYGNKEHSFVIFNLSRSAAKNYAKDLSTVLLRLYQFPAIALDSKLSQNQRSGIFPQF